MKWLNLARDECDSPGSLSSRKDLISRSISSCFFLDGTLSFRSFKSVNKKKRTTFCVVMFYRSF